MLLGPSRSLKLRRKVRQELVDLGYKKVVLMEDVDQKFDSHFLDEKFENIIDHYDPDLFVALFHSTPRMYAVIFEIGYIRGKFRSDIRKKLMFLGPDQYEWTSTTAYVTALAPKIGGYAFYNEHKKNYKASEIIRTFVSVLETQ